MKFFIYALMSLFFVVGDGHARSVNPSQRHIPIGMKKTPVGTGSWDQLTDEDFMPGSVRSDIKTQKDKAAEKKEAEERGLAKVDTPPTNQSIFESRKKIQNFTKGTNSEEWQDFVPNNPMQLPESSPMLAFEK